MIGSLLLRGMLVGLVAGLLAFGFARVFGEPQVDAAIAFEEASAAAGHEHGETAGTAAGTEAVAHDHGGEEELVSRETQAGAGLLTGTVIFGAAVGGIFALVFAVAYGRLGRLGARATSAVLAAAAFVSLALVPQIKYPATPPAVGNPDTIGSRTGLFFLMIAVSVVAMALAFVVARRLWEARGAWNAALVAGAGYLVLMVVVQYALPVVDEVPEGFSASVLWHFRVASLGIHAILWTVIGLGFGWLAERRVGEARRGGLAASAAYR